MLFNSYPFIFGFLPLTLILFFLIGKRSHYQAAVWLTLASLIFYVWWNPNYLLLLFSIGFNFRYIPLGGNRRGPLSGAI